jgi:hypothetical protein
MFDPQFENSHLIRDFVGLELAKQIIAKYDRGIFMPLLVSVYINLTLISTNVELVGSITLKLDVFGVSTFTKETTLHFLKLSYNFSKEL